MFYQNYHISDCFFSTKKQAGNAHST